MTQTKILGEQLNIQSVATDVSDDTIAITSLATGVTTDIGAIDVMYDDFVCNEIDSTINANSNMAVFVYDTSLDDDGGAWIKSATWQSWYSETLNTSVRGASEAFPVVVVIVVENNKLTIYDSTRSDMPMWMVINIGIGWASGILHLNAGNIIGDVIMKNGVLYVGDRGDTLGVDKIDFIGDCSWTYTSSSGWGGDSGVNIRERHDPTFYHQGTGVGLPAIALNIVNDLAIFSDGNMNNVLYVATDGGLSRIASDNTVSEWNDNIGAVVIVYNCAVFDGCVYWSTDNNPINWIVDVQDASGPLANHVYNDIKYFHFNGHSTLMWTAQNIPFSLYKFISSTTAIATNCIGTNRSTVKLYPTPDNWGNSMIANITSNLNSGIMHGDIRGSWLTSTDANSLVGGDILPDYTSQTGVMTPTSSPWYTMQDLGSFSINGGIISRTVSGAWEVVRVNVALVDAARYMMSITITNYVQGVLFVYVGSTYLGYTISTGTHYVSQVANQHDFIQFGSTDFVGDIEINYLNMVDVDASYNATPLTTVGTMDKVPVATGAELVGYKPLSSLGVMVATDNSRFEFADGDFCYSTWVKKDGLGENRILWHRGSVNGTSPGSGVELRVSFISEKLNWGVTTGHGISFIEADDVMSIGVWQHALLVRHDNVVSFYLDNKLQGKPHINGGVVTNNDALLHVGALWDDVDTYGQHWNGSIALLHVSATAPSREQITTIYEEEREMFKPNARCTLQGSSSVNTAVDYDKITNKLTVCTEDHITSFDGLVVVDDRAEIATNISTTNDYEITGS